MKKYVIFVLALIVIGCMIYDTAMDIGKPAIGILDKQLELYP
jgi:hypothetical protein